MRFTFTEDQTAFQGVAREVLTSACTSAELRAAWTTPSEGRSSRWATLGEIGLLGALVPEEHGGLGLDEVDLALVLEEVGAVALPDPLLETAVVAVGLLRDAAEDLGSTWLRAIACGDAVVAVGLAHEPFVVDAHLADLLLLEAAEGELHAVDPAQVQLVAQPAADRARRRFQVNWSPSDATRLAVPAAALARAADRAAWASAAVLVGVCRTMVELATQHAKTREQFGRPIGAFQAVKHHLANALLAVEFVRPAVYQAAYAVAQDLPTRSTDVSVAKALASDAATTVDRIALQVHGAIGYTWEHDLHLYAKRGRSLAVSYGSASHHRERVARVVLDGVAAGR